MSELERTFVFKLKPSKAQHERLRLALEHSRQLYNAALEERIDCYRKTGRPRSYYSQCMALTELRAEGSPWAATMERFPLHALDQAFKAFFKRGGFPRFRSAERYKTFGWVDSNAWSLRKGKFSAKGLGSIRVQQHREMPFCAKLARIRRTGRHWFLHIVVKVPVPEADESGDAVGIDLGVTSFAALSDGTIIANPRAARNRHAALRRSQRALARCRRGSNRRKKVRARSARAYLAMVRARRTAHFQTASTLTRKFSLIAVENLNVKGLARSALARDVNDAAWGSFLRILSDKAESAGRKLIKVDPRYTSQTCPSCGTIEPKKLSERIHACPCGYTADRDVAAAQIILHRAVGGPGAVNVGGYAERSRGKAAALIAVREATTANPMSFFAEVQP